MLRQPPRLARIHEFTSLCIIGGNCDTATAKKSQQRQSDKHLLNTNKITHHLNKYKPAFPLSTHSQHQPDPPPFYTIH